jgi:hypothetical protein
MTEMVKGEEYWQPRKFRQQVRDERDIGEDLQMLAEVVDARSDMHSRLNRYCRLNKEG